MATEQDVIAAYQRIFGYAPDREGLSYWVGQLNDPNSGITLANFDTTLQTAATEIKNNDVATGTTTATGPTEDVKAAYQRLFGYAPDQAGLEYWVKQVNDPASGVTLNNLDTALQNAATAIKNNDVATGTTTPVGPAADPVPTTTPTTTPTTADPGYLDLFQPTLYPTTDSSSATVAENASNSVSTSGSVNASDSVSTSGSVNASNSASTSGSTEHSESDSGIASWFTDPLLQGLLPTLQDSIKNLPGQVDQWTDKNLAASRSASKNLLDGHLTSVLADLAKRGLTSSTVASDTISTAAVDAAKAQSATDLGIMSNADAMKIQIPGILADVANLGNRSTSVSDGSSFSSAISNSSGSSFGDSTSTSTGSSFGDSTSTSTGSSSGLSSGTSTDPLAPYNLYSQLLLGMM